MQDFPVWSCVSIQHLVFEHALSVLFRQDGHIEAHIYVQLFFLKEGYMFSDIFNHLIGYIILVISELKVVLMSCRILIKFGPYYFIQLVREYLCAVWLPFVVRCLLMLLEVAHPSLVYCQYEGCQCADIQRLSFVSNMFQYRCLILEPHSMTSCGELTSSNRISWSLNITEVHNATNVLSLLHPSVESPYTKHSPSALRSATSLSWLFQLCINNVGNRAAVCCLLEAE
jgi:hypothetical protein